MSPSVIDEATRRALDESWRLMKLHDEENERRAIAMGYPPAEEQERASMEKFEQRMKDYGELCR